MAVRKKVDVLPVDEVEIVDEIIPVNEEIIEPGLDEPALEEIIPQPEFRIPENKESGMGIREN